MTLATNHRPDNDREIVVDSPDIQQLKVQLAGLQSGRLFNSREVREMRNAMENLPVRHFTAEQIDMVRVLAEGEKLSRTPRMLIKYIRGHGKRADILEYHEVLQELSGEELNSTDQTGRLFNGQLKSRCLATISNPILMSPHTGLLKDISPEKLDDLILDEKEQQRITFVDGLVSTTHKFPDRDTWAPNRDTIEGVKWLNEEISKFTHPIKLSAEVGVGSGLHSQALLVAKRALAARLGVTETGEEKHVISDIYPWAINAARRNIRPYLDGTQLEFFIGKGVSRFNELGKFDFIVSNPPYLPHPDGRDGVDRYSGDGLPRELCMLASILLNPDNPDARILFQCDNTTQINKMLLEREFPGIILTRVQGPVSVPLRFYSLKEERHTWVPHLQERGLEFIDSPTKDIGYQKYWHNLEAWTIRLRR